MPVEWLQPGCFSGIVVGGSAAPCTAIQFGRHYPSCRIGRGQAFLQGMLRMPQRRRRWFRLFSGLAPVGADICKAIFGAQGAAEKISLKGGKTHRGEGIELFPVFNAFHHGTDAQTLIQLEHAAHDLLVDIVVDVFRQ